MKNLYLYIFFVYFFLNKFPVQIGTGFKNVKFHKFEHTRQIIIRGFSLKDVVLPRLSVHPRAMIKMNNKYFFMFFYSNIIKIYSVCFITSTGQPLYLFPSPLAQIPQPVHLSTSITAIPFCMEIAPYGHLFTHNLQPIQPLGSIW